MTGNAQGKVITKTKQEAKKSKEKVVETEERNKINTREEISETDLERNSNINRHPTESHIHYYTCIESYSL